ncbi:MAG: DUF1292 domain-containing protein [Agathobacter sp.]|nr:DUF1292 domain-containing protein [Agathobacter sp.]
MSNEQLLEFDTFVLEMNGKEIEFAITEEFDYEGKHYILCGEVNGDEINDEEVYLFRAVMEENEITVESIETEEEYDRIVEAYYEQNVEMETEE